jgi:hypothetical protein
MTPEIMVEEIGICMTEIWTDWSDWMLERYVLGIAMSAHIEHEIHTIKMLARTLGEK